MQFYTPHYLLWLWSIPVVLVVFYLNSRIKKRYLARLGNLKTLERMAPTVSPARRWWRIVLVMCVFFFSVLALARPQWGEEKKKVERKGVDVIFILDTSLSMLAEDIKPNRIGKAKLEIRSFVEKLKGDRIGLITFAGTSFLQCPLTLDYGAFLMFMDSVEVGHVPLGGTSLGEAIDEAVKSFPEKKMKYKVIIVFSDGESHEPGAVEAAETAKKAGIRIYTIGTGTKEGELIPLRAEKGQIQGYKKDREGQTVVSKLNEAELQEIASVTSGLYFPATPAEKEIDIVYDDINRMGKQRYEERLITEKEDHFQIFLIAAFISLLLAILIGEERRKAPFAPEQKI